MPKLTRDEIQRLLTQAEDSFPHARDVCSTCECFLGYLAQLRPLPSPPQIRNQSFVDKPDFYFGFGEGAQRAGGVEPVRPGICMRRT